MRFDSDSPLCALDASVVSCPSPTPAGLRSRAFLLTAGVAAALALTGCRAGPKNFDNENDSLRRELQATRDQLERSKAEAGELRAKLSELQRARDAATGPAADVLDALPRCAGIRIGSRSGLVTRNADGKSATAADVPATGVEVLIEPFDGRQRFVQVAGRLTVDATLLPPTASAAAPRVLGTVTLTPGELREAYRSSFMGTHYVVTVPIASPGLPRGSEGSLVLRATLDDAVTGSRFESTSTISLR